MALRSSANRLRNAMSVALGLMPGLEADARAGLSIDVATALPLIAETLAILRNALTEAEAGGLNDDQRQLFASELVFWTDHYKVPR